VRPIGPLRPPARHLAGGKSIVTIAEQATVSAMVVADHRHAQPWQADQNITAGAVGAVCQAARRRLGHVEVLDARRGRSPLIVGGRKDQSIGFPVAQIPRICNFASFVATIWVALARALGSKGVRSVVRLTSIESSGSLESQQRH
jgi:hypothetical protein